MEGLENLNKLFMGGMQRHFPRNEAQLYKNLFSIDVSSYCIKDYSSKDLTDVEIECVERLAKKNIDFMNL